MSTAEITKLFEFEAAHQLPYHHGHCQRVHGHSYKLEVSVHGSIKPDWNGGAENQDSDRGMVCDFGDLSLIVKHEIISRLDHTFLNDLPTLYSTAENLAHWMWGRIAPRLPQGVTLSRLVLHETRTGSVTLTPLDVVTRHES